MPTGNRGNSRANPDANLELASHCQQAESWTYGNRWEWAPEMRQTGKKLPEYTHAQNTDENN